MSFFGSGLGAWQGWAELALLVCLVVGAAKPLGHWLARVFDDAASPGPAERALYRLLRVDPAEDMSWQRYAVAVLAFNGLGVVLLFLLLRLQAVLPFDPERLPAVAPDLALNTAISFVTNTNWQAYGGETTLGPLVQAVGLTVQNFVSAATGLAVAMALIRGIGRVQVGTVGNFWRDLVRGTLFVLLPLSTVLALILVSQGVVQTLDTRVVAHPLDHSGGGEQILALGAAASQVAIKQLGTNGGGFFNANASHPLENGTPLSNFLQVLAILLLPAALCHAFGKMVRDARQGWMLLAAMTAIFVPLLVVCFGAEQSPNPALVGLPIDHASNLLQAGGNMEGKEARFGIAGSALFATATTAASCGAVDAMHDSFNALGGLVPMWLMQLGEVVFGGVGAGLYGMLMFVVIAVFVSGLMVGRTPEYLGKKIEAFEMKMASLAILVPAATALVGTAFAVTTDAGRSAIANPGPHGFSEVLYAFSSAANNNGSAFAGLSANNAFYNISLGVAMLAGRFGVIVPVLAAAGSLSTKKRAPASPGTLPTHTPLFTAVLVGIVMLVGALTFVPALALGPIVEHVQVHATSLGGSRSR